MGALTSKPYAFHGRYWEVIDHDIFDTSNSLIVPIKAGLRGNDFLRVLPSVFSSKSSSGEWISDKTRFSYFGFKYQRFTRPLLRSSLSGKFAPVSWRVAVSTVLTQFERSSVSFFLGPRVDLETCFSLKLLTSTLPAARFSVVGSDLPQNSVSSFEQSDFVLGSSGLDFSDSNFSLFVSYEFDSSLPILDYQFKQTFSKSSNVFTLGSNVSSFNMSNVFSLGLSTKSFLRFFRGKSRACRVMARSNNPYVFFSSGSMTSSVSSFFFFFKYLCFSFRSNYFFSLKLAVLPFCGTTPNFLEVFGAPRFGNVCSNKAVGPKLNYFVDYSTYVPIKSAASDFSIFQGSNFNPMLSFTNLVLPTPFPLEDSGTYSDIFGLRKFSIGLPTKLASDVRSSYKIFLHLYSLRLSQFESMSVLNVERIFSLVSESSVNRAFFLQSHPSTSFTAFNSHHYTYNTPIHPLRSDLLSLVSAPLMLQAKMFVENRAYVHFF